MAMDQEMRRIAGDLTSRRTPAAARHAPQPAQRSRRRRDHVVKTQRLAAMRRKIGERLGVGPERDRGSTAHASPRLRNAAPSSAMPQTVIFMVHPRAKLSCRRAARLHPESRGPRVRPRLLPERLSVRQTHTTGRPAAAISWPCVASSGSGMLSASSIWPSGPSNSSALRTSTTSGAAPLCHLRRKVATSSHCGSGGGRRNRRAMGGGLQSSSRSRKPASTKFRSISPNHNPI